MKNFKLTLTNRRIFDDKLNKLQGLNPGKPLFVTVSDKAPSKRSLSANAVYQSWYPAISDHIAMTIVEATRYIKLTIALPILRANKDFGFVIEEGLRSKGFYNVSYERQLLFMDKMPVTRLFTTEMHNRLRDDIQYFFGQQGLVLEYEK